MLVYFILISLTFFITVLPGVASWIVSRTSSESFQSTNFRLLKPGIHSLMLTDRYRGLIPEPNIMLKAYSDIETYTEARNSQLNSANVVSLAYLCTFCQINSSYYNPLNDLRKPKLTPFTVDYASVYMESSVEKGYFEDFSIVTSITVTGEFYQGQKVNNYITNHFKQAPETINSNVSLLKNNSLEYTTLHYYENPVSSIKCFISSTNQYIVKNTFVA